MGQHDTEQEVYDFICDYMRRHGSSPTLREIRDGCFMSIPNVIRYLDRLEAHGRIARRPGKARGITLRNPDSDD